MTGTVPRNVRTDSSCHHQLRAGNARRRGNEWDLLGMVDLNHASVLLMFHLRRRRRFGPGVGVFMTAAGQAEQNAQHQAN